MEDETSLYHWRDDGPADGSKSRRKPSIPSKVAPIYFRISSQHFPTNPVESGHKQFAGEAVRTKPLNGKKPDSNKGPAGTEGL
jgi:hypothetical protein